MNNTYTNEQQIIDWLEKHKVKNYRLVPDKKYGFIVNVNGDVNLRFKELINIPIKFNKITGSFYCHSNKLTSLEFSPQTIMGSFDCSHNKLTSLEFCPQEVGGSFFCSDNQLASLEFCPQTVKGSFLCNNNQLTSLEFCPQTVVGDFWGENNQLTSLEFCPQTVSGSFSCENNPELKKIQKITNFKLIYLEHEKTLITKFSDKLENDLIDNSKKTAKIKI